MKDPDNNTIRLFLCGDVMTGRGIDQILPHPVDPVLHESYMKSAEGYVELVEQAHGEIPEPVDFTYIWSDAIAYWESLDPDLKLINLETSITTSDDFMRGKAVTYRMSPENIPCLTRVGIDYCALANNHIMDYGMSGLLESMKSLREAGIPFSGAGNNLAEARQPAVLKVPGKGRVLVFSIGMPTSGVPFSWAAGENKPGVYFVDRYAGSVAYIGEYLEDNRTPGDIVLTSIHWGANWGYEISPYQRDFAHALIDEAGVDIVHGHSSHHVKGIEVYRDRPIIYGAGDFLNDYEGISGYETFRDDLTLMYFPDLEPATGKLTGLRMVPLLIRNLKLNVPDGEDIAWMHELLKRECKKLGSDVILDQDGTFRLTW